MKNTAILLLFLLPLFALSQDLPAIGSTNYSWKTPDHKMEKNLLAATIFSGSTNDLEYLQMDACSLAASKKATSLQVPGDEEYMLIIKSGTMKVSFGNSGDVIGRGSVALLVPGEEFSLRSDGNGGCQFYLMKYRSRSSANTGAPQTPVSSITNWNNLAFKAHDKGGVRKYFEMPTAMFKRLEMHVTTLNAGLKSHDPHTHRPAEIILLIDDEPGRQTKTEMVIGDHTYQASAGGLYYVGANLLHGIRNTGTAPCSYFAFQFE